MDTNLFGRIGEFTTEHKSSFTGEQKPSSMLGTVDLKKKFLQGNVHFSNPNRADTMKTVAQANELAKGAYIDNGGMANKSPAEMSRMMRAANFNMGSIPPEHDRMLSQKYAARTIPTSVQLNSHRKTTGVSEGNRLMKGKGDYLT